MWAHTTLTGTATLSIQVYLLISTFCSHSTAVLQGLFSIAAVSLAPRVWVRCCRPCTSRTAAGLGWAGLGWGHPTIIHDAYTMCAAARAAAGPRLRIHHPHSYHLMHRGHHSWRRGHLAPFSAWSWGYVKMYCPSNKHTCYVDLIYRFRIANDGLSNETVIL